MGITNQEYFLLFALTYLLVGGLTPIMRRIAIATDVVDRPNSSHKSHKKPVPYLGGVAIIIGVITVSFSASLFSNFTSSTFWLATSVLGPALALGFIGLWDDIKNLKPLPRFIAQSFAGIFTAVLLVVTDTAGNPTGSKLFVLPYWDTILNSYSYAYNVSFISLVIHSSVVSIGSYVFAYSSYLSEVVLNQGIINNIILLFLLL